MVTREDVIDFFKVLYPTPPYNVRIFEGKKTPVIHDMCFNVEEIYNNYEKFVDKPLHWFITINPHKRVNGWIKPSGIVNKMVLDFDSEDDPDGTIEDAQKVCKLLDRWKYKYLVFTTGKKGLHIHLMVNKMEQEYVKEGVRDFWLAIEDKVGLNTLDHKVIKDQPSRITRIPGIKRPDGDPMELVDVFSADVLNDLDRLSILDVDLPMRTVDGRIEERVKALSKPEIRPLPKKPVMFSRYKGDSIENWHVMDKIFPQLYETGKHLGGTKYQVLCPFHNDHNPSAFYNHRIFHCSTCDVSVEAWRFLTELVGKSKDEARQMILDAQ